VEEALQASEEGFRNIYEESPIGIELYDCDGRLLTANRACLAIFGVSNVAEVQGFKLFEDPNITDEVKQRLSNRKTVRYETPFDFEKVKKHKLYNTSKSGTIHLNMLITPLGVRGENLSGGYLVQVQDITERKRAEEELRMAEQSFRNSLDSSPLGIRIVTAEGELLYANQAILDIYGYSSVEELKSVPTKQRYTPESYVEYQIRKAKRKQGEPVPDDYEINIVRKDGEVRHLAVLRKEVIWGGEIQYQTLYQDITERRLMMEELKIFKAISDRAGYGAGMITPEGELIYINTSFAEMHGYTIEELLGKHFSVLHTKAQMRVAERFRKKIMQEGIYVAQEVWHNKKDGTAFPTLMAGTAIKDDMGEILCLSATLIDITEQKRLEANMEFYLSEITKAQEEERKRIAREIHDESIQSLATLALGIDAIAREKERLPEDVIGHLKGLRTEANSILDGLRRFSHELRPGDIDHVGLVPALEFLTDELNKENRVKANLEVAGSERRLIPDTELALFRIAQEALRNVKRHSRATRVTIRLKFIRGRVRLTVSDDGRGFEPPDTLSDFAVESKLGLVGIQERTRLLRGKLLVRSWVGRGTMVVVEVADIQGMKG